MKKYFLIIVIGLLYGCTGHGTTEEKELTNEQKVQKGLEIGLDLLVDYDRNAWPGPYGWNDEQWVWKKRLRWDNECDYLASIDKFSIDNELELVKVTCTLGAYQPAQYLYLYTPSDKKGRVINFYPNRSDEKPYKVWGSLEFVPKEKYLIVFAKSRGAGDCGSYEIYDFKQIEDNRPKLIEWRTRECSDSSKFVPPEQWPLQELGSNG